MVESSLDAHKYSSRPVYARGGAEELAQLLATLQSLDRKAEWRSRLWLGPGVLLRGPLMGWLRLGEPWRTLVGLVTLPIWMFPLVLAMTLFLPFTIIWLIVFVVFARKDISNQLLDVCAQFLVFWKKHGSTQEKLCITVDARLPLMRTREIPLQDLGEDAPAGLTGAAETECFRFEAPGMELQVTQQFRILDRKAGIGESATNFLAETHNIEGQSWYRIELEKDGRQQRIDGPVHTLPGQASNRSTLVDFHGLSLQPDFPWTELASEFSGHS